MCSHLEALHPHAAAILDRMDAEAPKTAYIIPERPDTKPTIELLRKILRERTGKSWTVKNSTGSAWGWIKIHAEPRNRVEFGYLSAEDEATLRGIFGSSVTRQGVSIPSSSEFYRYYLLRAAGLPAGVRPQPYWD